MEDFLEDLYPEITLETDDILMSISVKKDYSQIKDVNLRKKRVYKRFTGFYKRIWTNSWIFGVYKVFWWLVFGDYYE